MDNLELNKEQLMLFFNISLEFKCFSTMKNLTIQKVTLKDINQLQTIGRQTFHETFASHNTRENMTIYLEEAFATIKLTAELNDNNIQYYFAKLKNEILGYLKSILALLKLNYRRLILLK